MRLFNILLSLIFIFLANSCNIVSVDPVAENTVDELEEPETDEGIDVGSGETPTDSAVVFTMLTDGSSKTWGADDFLLEGMGISTSQSCRLDDQITFNADGTFLYNSGDWLCGAEDNSEMRSGTFSVDLSEEDPVILFQGIEGFGNTSFSGKIWTLEEDLIVISSVYNSQVFGSFEVTGRYTTN